MPLPRPPRIRVVPSQPAVPAPPPPSRTRPQKPHAIEESTRTTEHSSTSRRRLLTWLPFSWLFFRSSKPSSAPPVHNKTRHFLRVVLPLLSIGLFTHDYCTQVLWVRGPSMSPCLNEGYEHTNTESDMVLVNMLPFNLGLKIFGKTKLERGMIVTFWYARFFFFFWQDI